jgi:hypothetical protein
MEIMHEDVIMRLFSNFLVHEVSLWFRDMEAGSFSSWPEFYYAFSKYGGENKSLDQYLADCYVLRRGEEESLATFKRRLYNVYYNMTLDI